MRSRAACHAARDGLFRRAIVQSLPGSFFTDELARDIAAAIAAEVGLSPTAADLSGVDPYELPAAGAAVASTMRQHEARWGQAAFAKRLFAPVVDGELLPTTPWQALAAGKARQIDLIAGHNRDEYRLFMAVAGQIGKIGDDQAALALREFPPARTASGPTARHSRKPRRRCATNCSAPTGSTGCPR